MSESESKGVSEYELVSVAEEDNGFMGREETFNLFKYVPRVYLYLYIYIYNVCIPRLWFGQKSPEVPRHSPSRGQSLACLAHRVLVGLHAIHRQWDTLFRKIYVVTGPRFTPWVTKCSPRGWPIYHPCRCPFSHPAGDQLLTSYHCSSSREEDQQNFGGTAWIGFGVLG